MPQRFFFGWQLYTILLIACVGLRLLLAGLNVRLLSQSEVRLKNGLRRRLLVRLMGVTPDGRFRRHSGDVLNRLGEDVRVVANLLGRVVPSLVSIVVQFIAAFLFLSHLEPLLAVSVVVIMPVCLLIARLFAVRIRRLTSEIRQRDGEVQSHIQEVCSIWFWCKPWNVKAGSNNGYMEYSRDFIGW